MKKKTLLVALVIVIALSAWSLLHRHGHIPTASARAAGGKGPKDATPVATLVVRPQAFAPTFIATGTVHADESVEIQPEIAGKLQSIHFQEGSSVRTGELLAVLNDAELHASLQRALYRREFAELKARRIQLLINRGGVPQQDYDIAASELSVLGAEVDLIRAQLARTEIRAPFDGVVGLRNVSVGAQVSVSTQLTTLQRVGLMKIDFSVPEKYASVLVAGSQVEFTVAGSNRTYPAEVYAVEPRLEAATRTRLIRARAPNPDLSLLPGAFARVTVPLARLEEALLVPTTALGTESGEKIVFVVENGRARRQVVQTGLRRAESVLITAGLNPGDEVIVRGLQLVRPGTAIEATQIP